MNKKNLANAHCPIARSLACVGDTWSLLILRDALAGIKRFDDFRKSLGIAPTMLTQRLGALTEEGLLTKQAYSEKPLREEYILTESGLDFAPVLVMLGAWSMKHRHEGHMTKLVNGKTGQEIIPDVVDTISGSKISDLLIQIKLPENLS